MKSAAVLVALPRMFPLYVRVIFTRQIKMFTPKMYTTEYMQYAMVESVT